MIFILLGIIIFMLLIHTYIEPYINHSFKLNNNFQLCRKGHLIKNSNECQEAVRLLGLKLNHWKKGKTDGYPTGCSWMEGKKTAVWNSMNGGQANLNYAPICNRWKELKDDLPIDKQLDRITEEITKTKIPQDYQKIPIQFNITSTQK